MRKTQKVLEKNACLLGLKWQGLFGKYWDNDIKVWLKFGTRDMAQWAECLPHIHEVQDFDP